MPRRVHTFFLNTVRAKKMNAFSLIMWIVSESAQKNAHILLKYRLRAKKMNTFSLTA